MNFDSLFNNLDVLTLDGLTRGSIYALVALGYTMVYGVMRLINFAHSEVFMVGTWTVLGVYTVLGADAESGLAMVLVATVLALAAAMLASAGVALTVERVAYRPLRKKNAPPLIFLITAIGCSLVLVETFGQVLKEFFGEPFGRAPVSVPSPLQTEALFTFGDLRVTNVQV
ncbi:MAG TPA: branched-chain amino acid ABC transporter permease, partial [Nocardioidaceae bacterium]|nr:branched-chain amino acid ABC transporter permease [Nocardioidaceae bacterium]